MIKRTTKRRNLIGNAETLVAVERERERERERGCLYRLNFLSLGRKSEFFSTDCGKSQSHRVCHLVNNKIRNYNEYIENKGRTMLFYNGIGLSLCAFEQIKLVKARFEKVFKITKNISENQLICSGAREGP